MIYVFFAQGFEEIEALAAVDVLRRAKLNVLTVGINNLQITGSHNITVLCDYEINQLKPNDSLEAIVLPGGMPGTKNLGKSSEIISFIDFAYKHEKLICAICAAPMILGHIGLLAGRQAVCFPGFEGDLRGAHISDKYVCRDGNIITAKGMGCAIDFAIEIAKEFIGKQNAEFLKESLQCP